MNKFLSTITILVFGVGVGFAMGKLFTSPKKTMESGPGTSGTQSRDDRAPLYWVAPMDPTFRSDKPGKSPMGMELVPVYDDSNKGQGPHVLISPQVVNNLGVRTKRVERGALARVVSTVGYLDYDETRISHIHTRTEGWIERLTVRAEGEQVKQGQLLFELYAPTLVNAQEEYLQALAGGNKLLLAASHERLLALGISESQVNHLERKRKVAQYVKFYAPQSGVLSRLNVREGMYIKPDTEVMSLANLDQVWLLAEVFERQANWVKTQQVARARLPSLPGRLWSGHVEYIYPELDPVTRTLRVRLRFDNSERLLMPNMYAHVEIHGEPVLDVLSIPREALIRNANQNRVIVALGEGRFEAREVIVGIETDNSVEVNSGLAAGEEIVIAAQFLIDSEASLRASLQRLQPIEEYKADIPVSMEAIDND